MPLPKEKNFTSEDYWNIPEGQRAELIDGQLCNMAPPSRVHQQISVRLCKAFLDHIDAHRGHCTVYPAPFAVNLDAKDLNWVEPDISVICDHSKLTDRGCSGAPDLVVEIVSPSSRRMDYIVKCHLYADAGVREYWIIDPARSMTTVYYFAEDAAPLIIPFDSPAECKLFPGFFVTVAELL